ncbi:uncharacterized protein IL334_003221 [Kwoniella shivajii]|uniref:Uncharacterized protein n=1 Tax=Kwoniella shivajii TaxID=564305 RepID=A0ABZ1CXH6_9TREE|nr:hypothetical protein IL334_003221 [Kwoniella shivajii]
MSDQAPAHLTIPTFSPSVPSVDDPTTGFCNLTQCHNSAPSHGQMIDCACRCHSNSIKLISAEDTVENSIKDGKLQGKKLKELWAVVTDILAPVHAEGGIGEDAREGTPA